MKVFIDYFEKKNKEFPMSLNIAYDNDCGWIIYVFKEDCGLIFPESSYNKNDAVIALIKDSDLGIGLSKTLVEMENWFDRNLK